MKHAARKFKLLPGSELLRAGVWWRVPQGLLKTLIKRFATREELSRRAGKTTYVWKSRRLRAVAIYESRFERVPDLFRARRLPPRRSYYVQEGKYVWPVRGEPGDPVPGSRPHRVRNAD